MDRIDELLEAPFWIIDILPKQVKKDSRVRGVLQGHKQITPDQTERKNQHLENVSVKPSVQ